MLQFDDILRTSRAATLVSRAGPDPKLSIWAGVLPPNCEQVDDVTDTNRLVTILLPTPWLAAGTAGIVEKAGVWTAEALNSGVAGYFRLYTMTNVCCVQGDCGLAGSTAALILPLMTIGALQPVTVQSFKWTEGGI